MAEITHQARQRYLAVYTNKLITQPEEIDVLLDSSDLTDKATGIPKSAILVFDPDPSVRRGQIEALPFERLREKLARQDDTLISRGESLQAVEITHRSLVSAFDYYRMASMKGLSHGHRTYGAQDVLNSRLVLSLNKIDYKQRQDRNKKGQVIDQKIKLN